MILPAETPILEQVILVDAQDNPIGIAEKMHAHQAGLLHRAFSVCILRQQDKGWDILLQQRALTKYHSGGLWTNTCCSHPRPHEDIIAAGLRRLQEEMGFTVPLRSIGHFIYRAVLDHELIEHELDYVLIGILDEIQITPNPEEVMAYKWENLADLNNKIQEQPAAYTAWLGKVIQLVQNFILVDN